MKRISFVSQPMVRALALSLAAHIILLRVDLGDPATPGSSAVRAQLRAMPRAEPQPALTPPVTDTVADAAREPPERSYPTAQPSAAGTATAAAPGDATVSTPPGADEPLPVQAMKAGIDFAGLREYHVALGRTAARFRNYPPRARAAGWEGRVPMRLTISAAGIATGLVLIGTSSHTILDEAALEMMRMAASHTSIPESLRGHEFSIDLAVDYNLADDQ